MGARKGLIPTRAKTRIEKETMDSAGKVFTYLVLFNQKIDTSCGKPSHKTLARSSRIVPHQGGNLVFFGGALFRRFCSWKTCGCCCVTFSSPTSLRVVLLFSLVLLGGAFSLLSYLGTRESTTQKQHRQKEEREAAPLKSRRANHHSTLIYLALHSSDFEF